MLSTETYNGLPVFHDGNEYRLLGRTINPHSVSYSRPFSQFLEETANPVLDLSKLDPYDRYQKNVPILNQGQVGSCNAHAHTTALEKVRDLEGQTYIALSADSLYAQIDGNRDAGSAPEDAIVAMQNTGICLLSDVPDNFILWSHISDAAKQTAKRFRIAVNDSYTCANFAEMVTADYLGFAITFTIRCGNNFNNISSEGVVGLSRGMGNHDVSGGEAYKRLKDGTPAYRFRNSWDTTWGDSGMAWITEAHFANQPYLVINAIKRSLSDPNDSNLPPAHLLV